MFVHFLKDTFFSVKMKSNLGILNSLSSMLMYSCPVNKALKGADPGYCDWLFLIFFEHEKNYKTFYMS